MESYVISRPDLMYSYTIYRDGTIINNVRGNVLKPSNDPRRPNEPPIVYLKRKDSFKPKRVFEYLDILMAKCFILDFDPETMAVIHKDGNRKNCHIDNLIAGDGLTILRDFYNETVRWAKVEIGRKLTYNYFISEDGRLYNASTDSFVLPFETKVNVSSESGTLRFNLYYGKTSKDVIHYSAARLVAETFLSDTRKPTDNLVIIKDSNWKNIRVDNLMWGDNYDRITKGMSEISRDFNNINDPIFGKEKWKKLKYFDTKFSQKYLISSFGRIYNKDKKFYSHYSNGTFHNSNGKYYKSVMLCTDDGYKKFPVHRLVAYNFCELNPLKTFVNHINGNPECNIAANLEWTTPIENTHHAIETNLIHDPKRYNSYSSDGLWRLNTFFAWVYSIPDVDDLKAYKFYTRYINLYDNELPQISFDEFIGMKVEKENDPDYLQLKNFYSENYSQI